MKAFDREPDSRLRLLAGWGVLLLYLGAFSPLGMGGAVLLGLLDADHQVVLRAGADKVRVVLHHRGNGTTHQHGALARALTSFARPVSASDPDHVLQFGATISVFPGSEQRAPFTQICAGASFASAESAVLFAPANCRLTLSARPPPKVSAQLIGLRSTVLLI
jgi:hypothetical protein